MSESADPSVRIRSDRAQLPEIDLARDAVLLDVDGTILDIAPTPAEVRVRDGLRNTLQALSMKSDGALALISGRTLEVLDRIFFPLKLSAIGCHGAQLRRSPEARAIARVPPLPETVKRIAGEVLAAEPRIRVEDKNYTVAFHYRGAKDREDMLIHFLRRKLEPFTSNLALLKGKCVVEVRPKDCDKGEAMRELMQFHPFRGRRPVFFGDDRTDEDVFKVLREFGGLGVSVGRHSPNAAIMVRAPADVRRWLQQIAAGAPEDGHDRRRAT